MIKKILKLIVSERLLDKNELARRAGIQVETLDDIIRLLVERGYLRMEVNGCNTEASCSGCHSVAECGTIINSDQVFYPTDKGKAYAKMNGGGS